MSPLLGGKQHGVFPYGMWVPIAARLAANNYTTLFTLFYNKADRNQFRQLQRNSWILTDHFFYTFFTTKYLTSHTYVIQLKHKFAKKIRRLMNDLVHMSTLSGSHCSHQDHQHLGWTDTDRRNSCLYFTILYNQPPVLCTATYFTRSSAHRRGTTRCVVSIEILPIATQQCRNYLYDKSWPNRWYEVGDLVGGNAC